ncbi:MAG: squalene--hopene cyclase [Thermoguttaceae bacterium]
MASPNPHPQPGVQPGQPILPQGQPLPQAQPLPQPNQAYPQAPLYPQGVPQAPGYPQGQSYPQGQPYPQTPVYPQGQPYPQPPANPQGQPYPPSPQVPAYPQGQAYPQAYPATPVAPQAPAYPQAPAAVYPQAQPGAVRPVLVQPGAATQAARPTAAEPKEEEGEDEELAAFALRSAPPWLVSAVLHMLGLIVLALWVVVRELPRNQITLEAEAVYAEKLGDQLEFDTPLAGNDPDKVEEPILTPDNLPLVDNPFAAPTKLDMELVPSGFTATSDIKANIGLALDGRQEGSAKTALLGAYGGTRETEASVQSGLMWLAKNQKSQGSWSLRGPYSDGAADDNPPAATAMALLAFQGAGNTHKSGKFSKNVAAGWNWLLQEQDDDGSFFHEGGYQHRFYTQGQCTIALCELYGMTRDYAYRAPAQLAVKYLLQSQSPEGGWRYAPQADSDVSVTGWIVMALQSARMAGLEVPPDTFRRVMRFLDKAAVDQGRRYPYQIGREASLTMTAEALLIRQYLGWPRDEARMIDGVDWIIRPENLVNFKKGRNVYYWYYATQVCHHMEGEYWKKWNGVMRQVLPEQQVKSGREAGSWDPLRPTRDEWEAHGGRLYVTCLSIYMLEVYYRHLPLYSNVFHMMSTTAKPQAEEPSAGNRDVAPGKDEDGQQIPEKPKADQRSAEPKRP